MDTTKLNKSTVWRGKHKGIDFKIIRWGKDADPPKALKDSVFLSTWNWNYYIIVPFGYFAEGTKEDVFDSIYFHGGMTYYEEKNSRDRKFVEVGCDYDHGYDMENRAQREYDVDDILKNVEKTIGDIHKQLTIIA